MKAAMMGFDQLALGASHMMVVGGMESMTQAPYLLPKMRDGARIGHGQVKDSMFLDGLEDAYEEGPSDGQFCRRIVQRIINSGVRIKMHTLCGLWTGLKWLNQVEHLPERFRQFC